MKPFRVRPVTKRFALKAALYRRLARKMGGSRWTFSREDLIELFEKESRGVGCSLDEMKMRNGFALGKWLRDIDVSNIREDLLSGDFIKYEFINTPISRLHNKSVVDSVFGCKRNFAFQ